MGARLDGIASDSIRVLHDRRIRGSRANIDHLVVTPSGVWVIDTKKYSGSPSLRVEGGILRPRVEKLVVGGRDKSRLVDGVLWQVECVREEVPGVPVCGILCFVDSEWPLLAGPFRVNGVEVLWPRKLVSRLTEAAPVSSICSRGRGDAREPVPGGLRRIRQQRVCRFPARLRARARGNGGWQAARGAERWPTGKRLVVAGN